MMTYPVITISPDTSIKEAGDTLTRYNINVLMVLDDDGILKGYISRHVVDRAMFLGLETRPIKEYMSLEFNSVKPEASLNEIQELIITNNIRILPVMKDSQLLGVITRTDLLNILIERSSTPEFLYDTQDVASPLRMKNIRSLLKERLPAKIVALLRELGAIADDLDFNAYLVGGVVRDVILKRKNLDLDIVTEGDAIKLAKTFARKKEARARSYPRFGTAVVVMPDGFKIDIATARIEHYESPAAPPEVKLSSLKRDLYRRDFTINTLAVHLNKAHYGTLIDHFGAMKDIKERVLRVIHSLSFVEDPTRILRAIRFEQRFGFRIGKLTESLIHNAVSIKSFENLSGQRFFAELKLILQEEDPVGALERMDDFGLLKFISPDLKLTEELRGILERIKGILVWFDLLYLGIGYEPWKVYFLGLTASLSTDAFTKLVERMQIQDRDIVHAISTRQEVGRALREVSQLKDKKNYPLYKILSPFSAEILLCSMAKTKSEKIQKSISTFFSRLKGTKVLLKGKDLIAMGYEPGPLFKDIFGSILQARLEGAVSTREDEIQFLKERFGERAQ
jgi:tRNA nucleotidyltransferase (CCA-adding enzyme)